MEAARAGNTHICGMLLRAGADLLSKDAQGCTALHWAARRGRGALVLSMLRTADELYPGIIREALSVKSDKGKKPIDVSRNTSTANLLMARMKDWKLVKNEKLASKMSTAMKRIKVVGLTSKMSSAMKPKNALLARMKQQQQQAVTESKESSAAAGLLSGTRSIPHRTPSMAAFHLDSAVTLPPIASAKKVKAGPANPWD
jgi:hypothetical protein|tara:strand:- start:495 stop:1094 length:600 start_codon:yes stop_codon:yes gene_type:complete